MRQTASILACAAGAAILVWSGQEMAGRYEDPGLALEDACLAFAGDAALRLYVPELYYDTADMSLWYFLTEAVRTRIPLMSFLMRETGETVVVEDEYTRQELIESGRRSFLQALLRENQRQAVQDENAAAADRGAGSARTMPEGGQAEPGQTGGQQTSPEENRQTTESGSREPAGTGDGGLPDGQQSPENGNDPGQTDGRDPADAGKPQNTSGQQETPQDGNGGSGQEAAEAVQEEPLPFRSLLEEDWEKLQDYDTLLDHYFVVDPVTMVNSSLINLEDLAEPDMTMKQPADQGYQILIYHTHSQESYADSRTGDSSTTVVGVGAYLKELLEGYGYSVCHVTDSFDLVDGKIDRNEAYSNARERLLDILEEHPDIQVVLDVHRDGVSESKHLVTEVDGRQTAKIMFFNGLSRTRKVGKITYLENPYIKDNLAFSFQTEYITDSMYPDLCRCIYLKGYRYNLDLRPQSMLVEVGAQTNTVEEAKNAMIPLAEALHKVLQ